MFKAQYLKCEKGIGLNVFRQLTRFQLAVPPSLLAALGVVHLEGAQGWVEVEFVFLEPRSFTSFLSLQWSAVAGPGESGSSSCSQSSSDVYRLLSLALSLPLNS